MSSVPPALQPHFPRPLNEYATVPGESLVDTLVSRVQAEPFNAIATGIFLLAILHTFAAARVAALAHRVQHHHDDRARARGEEPTPSILAELLHFLGEVEVVFGLWAVVLLFAITGYNGWDTAKYYLNDVVNYTEPLFVVVIMALAATRPIITFAEAALRRLAGFGGATPAAWWVAILTVGPVLGSFITEPAAMTICALLLARQFYDLRPSNRLKYATLGLLFVNVSVGGTLTHFAAPPVLMVARPFGWDTPYMLANFGVKAVTSIILATAAYYLFFRRELQSLATRPPVADVDVPEEKPDPEPAFVENDESAGAHKEPAPPAPAASPALFPVPAWLILVHMVFMGWTVFNSHYPVLFLGGFLFFLGFARATAVYQSRIELKTPLLVGFFLAGLVIHGGLQGWWIAPVLGSLTRLPLFLGASLLTAFNDNALITYLSTLVPNLDEALKLAVVKGAVVGGGLTVIANAPNPAGQALLSRFFGGGVSPLGLLGGALLPTVLCALVFLLW